MPNKPAPQHPALTRYHAHAAKLRARYAAMGSPRFSVPIFKDAAHNPPPRLPAKETRARALAARAAAAPANDNATIIPGAK